MQNISGRRQLTRNRIFRSLYEAKDGLTQQQLSNELDLSLPTIRQNLTNLSELGLIHQAGQLESTGGRRAHVLEVDPAARTSVGISLTEHCFQFVALDLLCNTIATRKREHGPISDVSALGEDMARALERFLDDEGIARESLLGVGIAVPGIVDEGSGRILTAPTLHVHDVDISTLTQRIGYRVHVANDANCAGYTEWLAHPDLDSLTYLMLSNGVGGAIFMDGKPFKGDDGRSGEFGHLCVEPGGRECSCGRHGCLEAYCSSSCLSDDQGMSLDGFFARLDAGDAHAKQAWDDYADHLAIGLNDIHMVLDSDIIIGGSMCQYLGERLDEIRDRTARLDSFAGDGSYVRIAKVVHRAAPFGAAYHYVHRFVETL
ncbi:MAG: ROK family transcriptional regulator [Atopobiaceae bacterium]|jgi:predicted NBD/HSP70 family sugar kinase|nr:ROK family transcriptional regulator [Atopobiaceae bacterium]MCI2172888.1 ROK family transcriptional regulator [Atopobiaceae bacterium]MCI2208293.1 ROK family transcriptional regulator [Atopobiaceae bacterium]